MVINASIQALRPEKQVDLLDPDQLWNTFQIRWDYIEKS